MPMVSLIGKNLVAHILLWNGHTYAAAINRLLNGVARNCSGT